MEVSGGKKKQDTKVSDSTLWELEQIRRQKQL